MNLKHHMAATYEEELTGQYESAIRLVVELASIYGAESVNDQHPLAPVLAALVYQSASAQLAGKTPDILIGHSVRIDAPIFYEMTESLLGRLGVRHIVVVADSGLHPAFQIISDAKQQLAETFAELTDLQGIYGTSRTLQKRYPDFHSYNEAETSFSDLYAAIGRYQAALTDLLAANRISVPADVDLRLDQSLLDGISKFAADIDQSAHESQITVLNARFAGTYELKPMAGISFQSIRAKLKGDEEKLRLDGLRAIIAKADETIAAERKAKEDAKAEAAAALVQKVSAEALVEELRRQLEAKPSVVVTPEVTAPAPVAVEPVAAEPVVVAANTSVVSEETLSQILDTRDSEAEVASPTAVIADAAEPADEVVSGGPVAITLPTPSIAQVAAATVAVDDENTGDTVTPPVGTPLPAATQVVASLDSAPGDNGDDEEDDLPF